MFIQSQDDNLQKNERPMKNDAIDRMMITIKKQTPLIITVVIIIVAVLFVGLWMSGILVNTEKPSVNNSLELKDANFSLNKLPPEIQHEIRHYAWMYNFSVDKWEFDLIESNKINLYAHDIRNESMITELQGKLIGNYTIRIIHDIEFETTRAEVRAYLMDLQKKSEYQIAFISLATDSSTDPTAHIVELAVFNLTPENEKLDKMIIKGWKIELGVIKPWPKPTAGFNATNRS